jgi:hypothetical protein
MEIGTQGVSTFRGLRPQRSAAARKYAPAKKTAEVKTSVLPRAFFTGRSKGPAGSNPAADSYLKEDTMAEVIAPKKTKTNQAELDRERETCAAKLESYAAILKINQGFSTVVAGLEDLKTAGLLNEEWANAKERIDDSIREVWGHQAMLNSSMLNLLTAVEESDAIQCIGRRVEKERRQKTEEPDPIRVSQNSADHRGRPN